MKIEPHAELKSLPIDCKQSNVYIISSFGNNFTPIGRESMTVILAIGAFQAIFFAIILLNRKPAFRANKILAIWLAIVCLHLVINYAEAIGYYRQAPQLIGVSSSFLLLYGPLLFLL